MIHPTRPVASGSTETAAPLPDVDALLLASGRGDRTAFSLFYEQTAPLVFPLIERVSSDPARSEQIALEIYRELWLTAPGYDPDRGGAVVPLIALAFDHLRNLTTSGPADPLSAPAAATRIEVDDVSGSLDFYLDRGFEIERAADGWVLLRRGAATVTVVAR